MAAAKEKTGLRLTAPLIALLLLLAAIAAPASSAIENRTSEKSVPAAESFHSQPPQLLEPHQVKAPAGWYDASDDTFALNRLTLVVSDSDTVAQYAYDALGRRIIKIVSNGGLTGTLPDSTTFYFQDGNQCVEETDESGDTIRQFVWGPYIDEAIQMKTYVTFGAQSLAAGNYYPLSDLLYRSQALTDDSGNIQETYDCDAYGNTLIFQAAGTGDNWWADDAVTSDQPACERIFTGRQYDPETQIYFFNARYYPPALGRFNSRDPIPGVNLYQFVSGNPIIYVDPFGQWAYYSGMGNLYIQLSSPGEKGPASTEVTINFIPIQKEFNDRCMCKEVRFIQIYYYTQSVLTESTGGLALNAWTLDADTPPYYPNGTWGDPSIGVPSNMIDCPGWQENAYTPTNYPTGWQSFTAETCAVCSKTGGMKWVKGDEELAVFGCVQWGHKITDIKNSYTDTVASQLLWIDTQWKLYNPPNLPGTVVGFPQAAYKTPGYAPTQNMAAELTKSYTTTY